jgi:hypothetical protein
LRRGDIIAGVLCFIVVVGFLLACVRYPYFPFFGQTGFGPDWDCSRLPETEPVCIKRVPAAPRPN